MIKKCIKCNKEFYASPSRIKNGYGKYCSQKCYSTKIAKKCLVCGKEFWVIPAHLKIGKGKYCSCKCYGKSKKGIKLSKEHKNKISLSYIGRNNKMEKSPNWKGGKIKRYGYIFVRVNNHPFAIRNYVREHRLVMEKHLGRYLTPEEVVHHINGIKTDNRIENLMLFANESEHQNYHSHL